MRKDFGVLRRKCFARCLQLAYRIPDKVWYCEGLANGLPHAWLSPKFVEGVPVDEDWCIDPTGPWKHGSKYPYDHIAYYGLRFDGRAAGEWLQKRSKEVGPTSTSLLKYPDEILRDFDKLGFSGKIRTWK